MDEGNVGEEWMLQRRDPPIVAETVSSVAGSEASASLSAARIFACKLLVSTKAAIRFGGDVESVWDVEIPR
jgi:hypothetical protein